MFMSMRRTTLAIGSDGRSVRRWSGGRRAHIDNITILGNNTILNIHDSNILMYAGVITSHNMNITILGLRSMSNMRFDLEFAHVFPDSSGRRH